MHQQSGADGTRERRLRLGAEPASVPGARRFVSDSLRAWGRDDLVDDAALCVSELAGNAALHGQGTYIEVSVLDLEPGVRVCVADDDPVPAVLVAPRRGVPPQESPFPDEAREPDDLDLALDAPTTGRGLAIVAVLARDWGVEATSDGKRVWAELAPEVDPAPDAAPDAVAARGADVVPTETDTAEPTDDPGDDLPEGWVLVRLPGCPVELSLRQDQHLDELVRELTLMGSGGKAESAALARRLEAILRAPAHARAAGRRQAQAALEAGEQLVDVVMAMPRAFAPEVLALQAAVSEADRLCEEERLLTLTSPPELRAFRAWMTELILGQSQGGEAPCTWAEWRAPRDR